MPKVSVRKSKKKDAYNVYIDDTRVGRVSKVFLEFEGVWLVEETGVHFFTKHMAVSSLTDPPNTIAPTQGCFLHPTSPQAWCSYCHAVPST